MKLNHLRNRQLLHGFSLASATAFCSTCWESLATELRMTAKAQHLKRQGSSLFTPHWGRLLPARKEFFCPDRCVSSLEPVWGMASYSSGLGRKSKPSLCWKLQLATLDTYHPHKHCFVRLFICTKPKRKAFILFFNQIPLVLKHLDINLW